MLGGRHSHAKALKRQPSLSPQRDDRNHTESSCAAKQLAAVCWYWCVFERCEFLYSARLGPVNVSAVVHADDKDDASSVVDSIEHAVRATTGTEQTRQVVSKRLANPAWLTCQIAEGELDDGRQHARRKRVETASRCCGETNLEGRG